MKKLNNALKVLRKLKFCLDCISPSVESERCFSAAGLFISRLKCLLGDEMLDSLSCVKLFRK